MKVRKPHFIGIGIAVLFIVVSALLNETRFFLIIFGTGLIVGIAPFVVSLMKETRVAVEKQEMFREFARNLVEGVRTGTPISRCILNLGNKNYGELDIHVKKLIHQISLGIPLIFALQTFSMDVNNRVISRSLTLIGEAERAGGNIGVTLEAVVKAVTSLDKINKERKAAISSLISQGYIIFVVFLIIIIVMQFKILPLVSGVDLGSVGGSSSAVGGVSGLAGTSFGGGTPISAQELSNSFLFLLLTQGFFSGLIIGKLAEGRVKSGVKHSFTLMILSFLVSKISDFVFMG